MVHSLACRAKFTACRSSRAGGMWQTSSKSTVAAAAVDAEAACMPVHGPSSAECVCLLRHRVVLCCCHQVTDEEPTKEQLRLLHATIKKVGERDSLPVTSADELVCEG